MTDQTTADLTEPDHPAAWALARHIADHPVSTVQAAFRYLNAPLTIELHDDPAGQPPATARDTLVEIAAQAIRDSNGTPEALEWWQAHPQLIPAHVYAAAALAVLPAPRAGADAVRALHQPMQRGPFTICAHCSGWDGKSRCLGVVTDSPCPTLRALDGPPAAGLHRAADETETDVTVHAVPVPGSNGISSCCGRPPCEFVGERLTRDPDEVTYPGPAGGAQSTLQCTASVLRKPHGPHGWEPQPGMTPVRCPGFCNCEHSDDEHSVYGCADECACEYLPSRKPAALPEHRCAQRRQSS